MSTVTLYFTLHISALIYVCVYDMHMWYMHMRTLKD